MNFYSFKVKDIHGQEFDLSQLKGKKVLLVNTASECGYTPQFGQMEELYEEFGGENFEIIGFPSNDFGAQDPKSNEEIAAFCQMNYGVTFPMMEKISIKGENAHPLYKWLQEESSSEVKWNFNKFLIDENGVVVQYFGWETLPVDAEILKWLSSE